MPLHVSLCIMYHHTYRCDDTRGCIMQFWTPDDEHMCSKHVEAWNKLIVKQTFCASSWLITEINRYHLLFYCTSYRINMFRALLCPSSGARDYDVDYHIGPHYHIDQWSNQHYSRKLLIIGIVMPETCWAYKKHNKLTNGIYLVFYSSILLHSVIGLKSSEYILRSG